MSQSVKDEIEPVDRVDLALDSIEEVARILAETGEREGQSPMAHRLGFLSTVLFEQVDAARDRQK